MTTIPTLSLVGVTGFGSVYVENLLALHHAGQIRFRDAVVVNPDLAAPVLPRLRAEGVVIHDAFTALTESSDPADWVCLPVGIPVHRLLTEQALAWGSHVLLEKPAAGSVADWQAMCQAEEKAGKRVVVGFQHVHDPKVQQLKRELVAGEWGTLQGISVSGSWPRGDDYYTRNSWAARREVGGVAVMDSPLQNAFAHFVHQALFLAGASFESWREARSVRGDLWQVRPEIETFDVCDLVYELDNGIPLEVRFSHACLDQRDPVLRLETDRGWVCWDFEGVHGERDGCAVRMDSSGGDGNLFEDVLVADRFHTSLVNAGYHVRAVDLVTRTLTPVRPTDAVRDPERGIWYRAG